MGAHVCTCVTCTGPLGSKNTLGAGSWATELVMLPAICGRSASYTWWWPAIMRSTLYLTINGSSVR